MCRGLALGIHKDTFEIVCKGLSSHSETSKPDNEDNYLKFEIIVDDSTEKGYTINLDEEYKDDEVVRELFKHMLTVDGGLTDEIKAKLDDWIQANENQLLRWLLVNQAYAKSSKSQNFSYCKAGEHQDFYGCEAGGYQYFNGCNAGIYQDFTGCKADNIQDFSYCKAKIQLINYIECKNEKVNDFIEQLSNENDIL